MKTKEELLSPIKKSDNTIFIQTRSILVIAEALLDIRDLLAIKK